MKKRPYILIVIVVLVAAAGYVAFRPRPIAVETVEVARGTVREYIAEDAKTRLDEEYIVAMPISGTTERLLCEYILTKRRCSKPMLFARRLIPLTNVV